MRRFHPLSTVSALVTGAALVVTLSGLDLWLYWSGALPVPAMNLFFAVLLVLVSGTLLQFAASSGVRSQVAALFIANRRALLPLVGCVFFSLLAGFRPYANYDEGPRYAIYIPYDAAVILLSMLLMFDATRRRWMRTYLIGALLLLASSVFTDAIHPGTYSNVISRAAGYPENPNAGAFALIALCCAAIDVRRLRAVDLGLLLVTGLGVLATLSRGGMLMLSVLLMYYLYTAVRYGGWSIPRLVARLVGITLLVGAAVFGGRELLGRAKIFSLSTQERLHALESSATAVTRDDERFRSLEDSWILLQKEPLFGYGSGYGQSRMRQGPHNIYLQMWIDTGLGGALCFVWLLGASALLFQRRGDLRGVGFIGLIAVAGIFSHNLFEERAFLVPLGMMLSDSYFRSRARATTALPATRPAPYAAPLLQPRRVS